MQKLPHPIQESLWELLSELKIDLEFSEPRKTKLADWRLKNGKQKITINYDLHPVQFFMTLCHEIAHGITWNQYKNTVAPHGKEWKNNYKSVIIPLLNGYFGEYIETRIRKAMKNPKAAGIPPEIMEITNPGQLMVNDINMGVMFPFDGKMLTKIYKKKTKWMCLEPSTGKQWLVHGLGTPK